MSCADFEDLILDGIDKPLSSELASHLESHLAVCEYCQSFFIAASEIDEAGRQFARPSPGPQFVPEVLRKIDRPKPHLPGFLWEFAGIGAVAAAGAFCFWHLVPNLIVGGGWLAATVIVCGGMCIAVTDT